MCEAPTQRGNEDGKNQIINTEMILLDWWLNACVTISRDFLMQASVCTGPEFDSTSIQLSTMVVWTA